MWDRILNQPLVGQPADVSPAVGNPPVPSQNRVVHWLKGGIESVFAAFRSGVNRFVEALSRGLHCFRSARPDLRPGISTAPVQASGPTFEGANLDQVKQEISRWPAGHESQPVEGLRGELALMDDQDQAFRTSNAAVGYAARAVSTWLAGHCGSRVVEFFQEVAREVTDHVPAQQNYFSVLTEKLSAVDESGRNRLERLFGDPETTDLMQHLYRHSLALAQKAQVSERLADAAVIGGVFLSAVGKVVAEQGIDAQASRALLKIALGCVPPKAQVVASIPDDLQQAREVLVPLIQRLYRPTISAPPDAGVPVEADYRR